MSGAGICGPDSFSDFFTLFFGNPAGIHANIFYLNTYSVYIYMYSTRSRSWRREAGPAGPGMGGGGAGNTGEAGASPGSQGRDFPRMRLLPKPFDGGKRAGSGMGMRDGGEFTRSHRLMAGIPEARGIGPDQRPGSFPRWVPTSPTCIPGSITLARQRGLGGGFHPSGRSVFTLREEKLRGSNTFLIRTPVHKQ